MEIVDSKDDELQMAIDASFQAAMQDRARHDSSHVDSTIPEIPIYSICRYCQVLNQP